MDATNGDQEESKSNPGIPTDCEALPTPSPLPEPGNDQLADYSSTIDPSYVIHLIRLLLPVNAAAPDSEDPPNRKEASCTGKCRVASQEPEEDPAIDQGVTGRSHAESDGKDRAGDFDGGDEDEDRKNAADHSESGACGLCEQEELREEAGCVLWDLAANEAQAEFLVDNRILEVLLAILGLPQSDRMREICLGILGNLACHSKPVKVLVNFEGLVLTVIQQLQFEDPPSLCETCRLLSAGLHSDAASAWITALQQEEALDRVIWIIANTMNSQLREKSTELLLAIVDTKQEAFCALLPSLLGMGLPELLTDLIECEVTAITEGTSSCGDAVLNIGLQIAEALSLSDEFATQLASNQKLFSLACQVIRLSHKDEVGPSGITGTVLIANLLTEKSNLIGDFLQDGAMVSHLLELLPTVSEDSGARNALWSVLQRVGRHLQARQADMAMAMAAEEAATVMVAMAEGATLLLDDLDDHRDDDELEDEERASAVAPTCGRQAKLATVVNVVQVMENWLASGSQTENGGAPGAGCVQNACQLLGNYSASPDSVMHDQGLRK